MIKKTSLGPNWTDTIHMKKFLYAYTGIEYKLLLWKCCFSIPSELLPYLLIVLTSGHSA